MGGTNVYQNICPYPDKCHTDIGPTWTIVYPDIWHLDWTCVCPDIRFWTNFRASPATWSQTLEYVPQSCEGKNQRVVNMKKIVFHTSFRFCYWSVVQLRLKFQSFWGKNGKNFLFECWQTFCIRYSWIVNSFKPAPVLVQKCERISEKDGQNCTPPRYG